MTLDAGRVVTAASMVDDLNTAMQWLSYRAARTPSPRRLRWTLGRRIATPRKRHIADPSRHYVHLAASGQGPVPGGDAFWSLPRRSWRALTSTGW